MAQFVYDNKQRQGDNQLERFYEKCFQFLCFLRD